MTGNRDLSFDSAQNCASNRRSRAASASVLSGRPHFENMSLLITNAVLLDCNTSGSLVEQFTEASQPFMHAIQTGSQQETAASFEESLLMRPLLSVGVLGL